MHYKRIIQTPHGPIVILAGKNLVRLSWCDLSDHQIPAVKKLFSEARNDPSLLEHLTSRILSAVQGENIDFDDIPTPSGTLFQIACWEATRAIPHACSKTYSEVANMASSPRAVRAIGQAMRANPLPIIIPCHRVTSMQGLGGYCGQAENKKTCRIKAALIAAEACK